MAAKIKIIYMNLSASVAFSLLKLHLYNDVTQFYVVLLSLPLQEHTAV